MTKLLDKAKHSSALEKERKTPRSLGGNVRGRLRESPKARAALSLLERRGWIAPLDPGTIVRGATRAKSWRIVKGGAHVV